MILSWNDGIALYVTLVRSPRNDVSTAAGLQSFSVPHRFVDGLKFEIQVCKFTFIITRTIVGRSSALLHYILLFSASRLVNKDVYSVFKKSDAKIEITITATNLIRIKYPLSGFNHHLSGAHVANFNKIHCTVFEQQLFKKWNSKTEVSNMENSP